MTMQDSSAWTPRLYITKYMVWGGCQFYNTMPSPENMCPLEDMSLWFWSARDFGQADLNRWGIWSAGPKSLKYRVRYFGPGWGFGPGICCNHTSYPIPQNLWVRPGPKSPGPKSLWQYLRRSGSIRKMRFIVVRAQITTPTDTCNRYFVLAAAKGVRR